jgi:hypothetical protein
MLATFYLGSIATCINPVAELNIMNGPSQPLVTSKLFFG